MCKYDNIYIHINSNTHTYFTNTAHPEILSGKYDTYVHVSMYM
jgi:hypothetical protein